MPWHMEEALLRRRCYSAALGVRARRHVLQLHVPAVKIENALIISKTTPGEPAK